jgi:hypothetical protein
MIMKTPFHEWILFLFSVLITTSSLYFVWDAQGTRERITALTIVLFFGLCSYVFAQTFWTRRQNRLHAKDLQVTIAPGVPLTMKRGRFMLWGASIFILGILMALTAHYDAEEFIQTASVLTALGGLAFLILTALGFLGNDYLLFEPEGFRVGNRKGSMLIVWKNIRAIRVGEFSSNQALYFHFHDPEALAQTAKGRWTSAQILKGVTKNRSWFGFDHMIMTDHYGLNATLLAKAIATYATDPQVRAELEKHLEIPNLNERE